MSAILNQHGTVVCTNCNDILRSIHSYKQPVSGGLVNTTPVTCLNCGYSTTWSVVKPQ